MHWMEKQFELSRHGDAKNVRPMEGLRGFAVFLVFLTHYVSLMEPGIPKGSQLGAFAEAIHAIGNAGVDLFFVLSGYLIYGSMISRTQDFLPFIRRRIARIYPAFSVVFVLYLVLSYARPAENKIPDGLSAATLYLLQNFLLLPGLFPIPPMITVAWSLSYEMFYYLMIPLTITLFRLRDRSPLWRVALFVAVAAAITGYCAVQGGHVRLIMFIAGILLYETLRAGTLTAPRCSLALFSLAAGLLTTMLPAPGPVKVLVLSIAFFVVCFACFARPGSWLGRSFSWTPLRWLGNISYSYYLLHGLALKAGFMVLFPRTPNAEYDFLFFVAAMPVMFAITLLPSAALFLAIERPFSLDAVRRGKTPASSAPVSLP